MKTVDKWLGQSFDILFHKWGAQENIAEVAKSNLHLLLNSVK